MSEQRSLYTTSPWEKIHNMEEIKIAYKTQPLSHRPLYVTCNEMTRLITMMQNFVKAHGTNGAGQSEIRINNDIKFLLDEMRIINTQLQIQRENYKTDIVHYNMEGNHY